MSGVSTFKRYQESSPDETTLLESLPSGFWVYHICLMMNNFQLSIFNIIFLQVAASNQRRRNFMMD